MVGITAVAKRGFERGDLLQILVTRLQGFGVPIWKEEGREPWLGIYF